MKHMRYFCLTLLFFICSTLADAQKIVVPVPVGELFDKITILEIKVERFTNEVQRAHVTLELQLLNQTVAEYHLLTPEIASLKADLLEVNKKLWDIEDALRIKESKKEFDTKFIQIARSVYYTNDERCRIKRLINELVGSTLIEEKQYTEYA